MDKEIMPPLMIFSGFLPTKTLIESLIQISNEVISMEKIPFLQMKNISTMIRRIKLLSSLFEDIQESINGGLPPSSILCLTELYSVIKKVKILIESCINGSSLWNLIQTQSLSNQIHVLVIEIGKTLDILPLSLLNLTIDTKEQVELLHKQAKRAEFFIDRAELQKRYEILELISDENNITNKGIQDFDKVRDILYSIGLKSGLDYEQEISKLDTEADIQAGTGGLMVVSIIKNLIVLLSITKTIFFIEDQNPKLEKQITRIVLSNNNNNRIEESTSCFHSISNIPDEYRCPISLDLIQDPVIVASGHTYDRNSIAQWINSGHHTCPKSGQRLIHMALIPNYALKSLINQWCQDNNIPESQPLDIEKPPSNNNNPNVVDHISATKAAADAVKLTAEFLVGKLATGSLDIQRQAAYELRLLAKTGMDNRRIIAESGPIPFLVNLLTSHDPKLQENVVTALLNLSIYDNNKTLIISAGAIDNIIEVLTHGKTMESRENAAATIFSLSIIDEYKILIGSRPNAIPALVRLLQEGTTSGKKDAATALFNLAVYNKNKVNVVKAGTIPLLIDLLVDDKAGIFDDSLNVLALLLGCNEGLDEIRKSKVLVPVLIDLLRFGTLKGKENSMTLLLGLCKDGGEEVARKLLMNPRSIPSLQTLVADGSLKARRKADALLRILNRFCSNQSRNNIVC